MRLLPAVNSALATHHADRCPHCSVAASRRDCPTLGLIASTLDLVIRCWRYAKPTARRPHEQSNGRDLRGAVLSRRLTDAESAALVEILDVLDLAATQAADADLNLPTLAGLAVGIVDSYRAVIARMATADSTALDE